MKKIEEKGKFLLFSLLAGLRERILVVVAEAGLKTGARHI